MSASTFVFLFAIICLAGEVAHGAKANVNSNNQPSSDVILHRDISDVSPYDYTFFKDHEAFYKFHRIEKKFVEACFICQAEGAELYYPKSNLEWFSVMPLIANRFTYYNFLGIWSGRALKDIPVGGLNGAQKPSDVTSEVCYMMKLTRIFKVIDCDSEQAFVCRRDKNAENNETSPAIQPSSDVISLREISDLSRLDYTFSGDQQTFYKFHKIGRNLADAIFICKSEGAELYYPKSMAEWQSIAYLIFKNTIEGIWVKLYQHGTVEHTAPDICIFMNLNVTFSAIDCDEKQAYFCQINKENFHIKSV